MAPRTLLAAVAAVLLLGHGAIHLWWLAPPPDAEALVDPARAWVVRAGVPEAVLGAWTLALSPLVFALYAASAAGVLGWGLGPQAWRRVTLAASVLSLALLVPYFDPAGWVGFAVDAGLIVGLLTPVPARLGLPRPGRSHA